MKEVELKLLSSACQLVLKGCRLSSKGYQSKDHLFSFATAVLLVCSHIMLDRP